MSTPKTINIAAAASLINGLSDAIAPFKASNLNYANLCFTFTYAGSYTLATLISNSVNDTFDVYLSASDVNDALGMAKVVNAGKVAANFPIRFIANDLVLVKNKAWVDYNQSPSLPSISKFDDVTDIVLGSAHIWVADPTKAPAGDYAADAFGSNWLAILTKAINDGTVGDDVQETLKGLMADPVPALGVVYNSDYLGAVNNPPTPPSYPPTLVNYAPASVNTTIKYSGAALTNATGACHDVATETAAFVNFLKNNPNYFTAKNFRLLTSNPQDET